MTTVHVVAINLLVVDECIEFFNISYHSALSVRNNNISVGHNHNGLYPSNECYVGLYTAQLTNHYN